MPSSTTEQVASAFELSPGARTVLESIMQLNGKSPGEILAEGLALAQLYEQTRRQNGRLMVEVGGKLQVIRVP